MDALYINGLLQTEIGNVASGTETVSAYIGRDNFTSSFSDKCSIWDVEIVGGHKWAGKPNGNTSAAWADEIGSINGIFNGSASIRNL